MARNKAISLTMAAADADGVCLSQTPAAGGSQNLTIAGALASGGVATMDVPRHVSITSAADDSARTFVITGTDRYGQTMTETVTGPATTVNGVKNFKTVTVVNVDDDTAGAIMVGSADELESQWVPWDVTGGQESIQHRGDISAGGSLTYELQHTLQNVQTAGLVEGDVTAFADATMTGETTDTVVHVTAPAVASRMQVSGFSSGTLTWRWLELRN